MKNKQLEKKVNVCIEDIYHIDYTIGELVDEIALLEGENFSLKKELDKANRIVKKLENK